MEAGAGGRPLPAPGGRRLWPAPTSTGAAQIWVRTVLFRRIDRRLLAALVFSGRGSSLSAN